MCTGNTHLCDVTTVTIKSFSCTTHTHKHFREDNNVIPCVVYSGGYTYLCDVTVGVHSHQGVSIAYGHKTLTMGGVCVSLEG